MKDKKKSFIKEILRYSVAGMSAFICDTAVKTLFYSWILPLNMGEFTIFGFTNEVRVILATAAGFAVGLIVNYIISIFYVFTTDKQKQMGRGVKETGRSVPIWRKPRKPDDRSQNSHTHTGTWPADSMCAAGYFHE